VKRRPHLCKFNWPDLFCDLIERVRHRYFGLDSPGSRRNAYCRCNIRNLIGGNNYLLSRSWNFWGLGVAGGATRRCLGGKPRIEALRCFLFDGRGYATALIFVGSVYGLIPDCFLYGLGNHTVKVCF